MIWIICKKHVSGSSCLKSTDPSLVRMGQSNILTTFDLDFERIPCMMERGPVAFSICMHNMQFHFCEVDLDFERMEEWGMETLWHFPFAYATPPRFMPLPVQCGKFQLQYEDTGNFEIDFREELPQNITTLSNCEKTMFDPNFGFLSCLFLVLPGSCFGRRRVERRRESGSATETFDRSSKPVVPNCLQPLSKTCWDGSNNCWDGTNKPPQYVHVWEFVIQQIKKFLVYLLSVDLWNLSPSLCYCPDPSFMDIWSQWRLNYDYANLAESYVKNSKYIINYNYTSILL